MSILWRPVAATRVAGRHKNAGHILAQTVIVLDLGAHAPARPSTSLRHSLPGSNAAEACGFWTTG